MGEWAQEQEGLYILICGNRNALGSSAMEAINLEPERVQQMRASNKILMELWNE